MSEPAFHQFKLRLPVDLFRQLEIKAAESSRSVSAEMIYRLESSLEAPKANDFQLTAGAAALLLRSRLSSVQALIAQLEGEIAGSDFDPEFAETIQSEVESLQVFENKIRHALVFVLKAKYADAPIPQEFWELINDLARMTF